MTDKNISDEKIENIKQWSAAMKKINDKIYDSVRKVYPNYDFDADKEYRLMKQMCKFCHYPRPLNYSNSLCRKRENCQICGGKFKATEYVINIYCAECARKYNVCVICGAEMD